MLQDITGDLCRRIMYESPVSLLRLLLILPPALHAIAIQARTGRSVASGGASVWLAEAKDLPPAAIAAALDLLALHASELASLATLAMTRVPAHAATVGATLARMLPLLSALTRLDLASCALGAANGSALVCAVPSLQQLADLDLSFNAMGPSVMAAFGQWPPRPLELTALSLADNAVGNGALSLLGSVLIRSCPDLRRLDTSRNAHVAEVALVNNLDISVLDLQPPPRLRELHLSSTDVTGNTADRTIVSQAASLTRLWVDAPVANVDDGGIGWQYVAHCVQLRDLRLECWVTFPSEPVRPLRALTSLALDASCAADGSWMATLDAALAGVTQLRAFSLQLDKTVQTHTPVTTDSQATALGHALSQLTGLTRLHIGAYLVLARAEAGVLLSAMAQMCELRAVTLSVFEVVLRIPAELAQAWPLVTSLTFDCPTHDEHGDATDPQVWALALHSWTCALPQLQHLSVRHALRCDQVQDVPVLSALTHLRLCAATQRLDRYGTLSLPLGALRAMLASSTALVSLELFQLSVRPDELPALFAALAPCILLTQLRLAHMSMLHDSARWAECVARCLPQFPHLQGLSLLGHSSKQQSAAISAQMHAALVGLTGLRELELTPDSAEGLPQFVRALAREARRLQHLRLYKRNAANLAIGLPGDGGEPSWAASLHVADADGAMSAHKVCKDAGVCLVVHGEHQP